MQIIGLGHYSRTGKDTLARKIQSRVVGVHVQPFVWRLKQDCYGLFRQHGLRKSEDYDRPEFEHLRNEVLPSLGMTPVQLWVAVGNAMRSVYEPVWIEQALIYADLHAAASRATAVIIPDVRFPNEVKAIRDRGGWLVKVVREGHGPKDTTSDHALDGFDDWDYVAGPTMEALRHDADYLAECLRKGIKPTQSAAMRAAVLSAEKRTEAKAA